MVTFAAKQPVPSEPHLKKASEYTLLGHSQKRFDGPNIVSGKATYGIDVRLPGMLHAKILYSAHPHAKIIKIDTRKAERFPGAVPCWPRV